MRTWMASMSSLPLPGSGFFPASTMLNPNLHDDLIPSIGDTPEIEWIAVPSYEPRGPYGAKEGGGGFDGAGARLDRQRHLRRYRCPHDLQAILSIPQFGACRHY